MARLPGWPILKQASGRAGVTLIEVVIAIFVLSIGILGIMSLFPAGYRLTEKAVNRSIGALAARHALARVVGYAHKLTATSTDPAAEPLAGLNECRRVGTISKVDPNVLTCRVLTNQKPNWTSGTLSSGYYIVMTSGTADGHVYAISGNTDEAVTCNATFNTGTERRYEPVSVGDNFAIIGSKTGSKCFPSSFLAGSGGSDATVPVATYGDPNLPKDQWNYCYGCVISAPPPEMRETYRLDIFTYRGTPKDLSGGVTDAATNRLIIGHFVAYMSGSKASITPP
jgi:type II secretory pathway pseudopilin PulG